MVNLDALSDEELVQQARAAFEANRAEDFRSAAGVLLKRHEKMIAGCVYRRLSAWGAERLHEDVVQDVHYEILAQLRAPRLKPALRVMFKLTVNTTCRDVVEIAVRHAGHRVPSRHATPRVAKRPDAVPDSQRVSLDQPVDAEHDDTLLQETIADDTILSPDALAIGKAERLEWMRGLSPEQRLMIAIYGDYQERGLKAEAIAVRRGLSVAEVKRSYTEACRILQHNKEH
jgi:hypothetical protein